MRFGATLLTALVMGTTAVTALQNIYIGTIGACGTENHGPAWYVWFIDGPACTTGTSAGPFDFFPPSGPSDLCGQNITILGHEYITFTGCAPPTSIFNQVYGPPTGVSDNGAPALTCEAYSLPDQQCPPPCSDEPPNAYVIVTTNYLCS